MGQSCRLSQAEDPKCNPLHLQFKSSQMVGDVKDLPKILECDFHCLSVSTVVGRQQHYPTLQAQPYPFSKSDSRLDSLQFVSNLMC